MKNKTLFFISVLLFLLSVLPALAQDINLEQIDPSLQSLTTSTPSGVVGMLINLFFVITGVTAFIYLLIGGFNWISSGGDKEALHKASQKIQKALIGLILVLSVYMGIRLTSAFVGINLLCIELPTIGVTLGGNCPASPGSPLPPPPPPTTPPIPTSPASYIVQGRIIPTTLPSLTLYIDGGSPRIINPTTSYLINNLIGPHTISISTPLGYTVGYTLCYNDIYCHSNLPTPGSSVTINTSGYADLYWHFTATSPTPISDCDINNYCCTNPPTLCCTSTTNPFCYCQNPNYHHEAGVSCNGDTGTMCRCVPN